MSTAWKPDASAMMGNLMWMCRHDMKVSWYSRGRLIELGPTDLPRVAGEEGRSFRCILPRALGPSLYHHPSPPAFRMSHDAAPSRQTSLRPCRC